MKAFPDCNLHFMPQRSESWFDIRNGNLTASEFGAWLTKRNATSDKARLSAICKLLAQIAKCDEAPNFENWAMGRGIELEPVACARFEEITGKKVMPVGFAKSKNGSFGCSPDGLLPDDNAGLELKCPVPATHVKYLLKGGLPDEYRFQVQGSMAVTGADSWHFMSYCPNLPDLHLVIERDKETELLLSHLTEFSGELNEKLETIKDMWNTTFKKEEAKS